MGYQDHDPVPMGVPCPESKPPDERLGLSASLAIPACRIIHQVKVKSHCCIELVSATTHVRHQLCGYAGIVLTECRTSGSMIRVQIAPLVADAVDGH